MPNVVGEEKGCCGGLWGETEGTTELAEGEKKSSNPKSLLQSLGSFPIRRKGGGGVNVGEKNSNLKGRKELA